MRASRQRDNGGREKNLRSATLAEAGEDIFGGEESSGGESEVAIIISIEIGRDLFRISPLFRCNGLGPAHRPARRRHP